MFHLERALRREVQKKRQMHRVYPEGGCTHDTTRGASATKITSGFQPITTWNTTLTFLSTHNTYILVHAGGAGIRTGETSFLTASSPPLPRPRRSLPNLGDAFISMCSCIATSSSVSGFTGLGE